MTASGVKLFDDDIAADVRDMFREHLSRGSTYSEATAAILRDFHELPGTEDESLLWLPLAVMQWEYGVLEPAIRDHAFRVIDDGTDLRRWKDDTRLCKAREKVLLKLRRRLSGQNRKPKVVRLRTHTPPKCPWETGDIFAYRLRSGELLLLRVVKVERFQFDEHPMCELLDWVGREIPEHSSIAQLKVRRNKRFASESVFGFPLQKKHLVRCTSTGLTLPPECSTTEDFVRRSILITSRNRYLSTSACRSTRMINGTLIPERQECHQGLAATLRRTLTLDNGKDFAHDQGTRI